MPLSPVGRWAVEWRRSGWLAGPAGTSCVDGSFAAQCAVSAEGGRGARRETAGGSRRGWRVWRPGLAPQRTQEGSGQRAVGSGQAGLDDCEPRRQRAEKPAPHPKRTRASGNATVKEALVEWNPCALDRQTQRIPTSQRALVVLANPCPGQTHPRPSPREHVHALLGNRPRVVQDPSMLHQARCLGLRCIRLHCSPINCI